jgi:aminopeptidase N
MMKRIAAIFLMLGAFSVSAQEHYCSDYYRYINENKIRNYTNSLKRGADLSVNYDLKYGRYYWKIDPDSNYISGSVTHYFSPLINNLNILAFELAPSLAVDSIIYHNLKLQPIRNDYSLQVELPDTVTSSLDSITIVYQGKPPLNWGSFEQDFHGNDAIIWTLSEPYGSRDWWPCKQSLNDKIDSIDVYVETPAHCKAAGNGVLVSSTPTSFGKLHHWKHRYPITAYLVAFAVTNYAEITEYAHYKSDSLKILNYIYPEDSAFVLAGITHTVPIMEAYMDKFGKYPFFEEKYGHAQFNRSGGMEHQTMSFMGFFNDMLIGHELGHQWFGDKITCGSWSDIWLNEGFATFAEAITFEYLYTIDALVNWRKSLVNNITSEPGGTVYVYGNDTNDISRVFNQRLSYQKGGMVLQMLRIVVGDSAFTAGIQNYLNDPRLAYGFAKTEDFMKHMEAASGKDLEKFFSDWIYNEGFPSYTVKWKQNSTYIEINISQQQSVPAVQFFELPIPLLLKINGNDSLIVLNNTQNNQKFIIPMSEKVDSINFDPECVLISRYNKVVKETSIDDTLIPEISIYPNPFRYSINISINRGSQSINWIHIYDNAGKLVQQVNVRGKVFNPGSVFTVYTTLKQSGEYILKIFSNDGMYQYSIIKQK